MEFTTTREEEQQDYSHFLAKDLTRDLRDTTLKSQETNNEPGALFQFMERMDRPKTIFSPVRHVLSTCHGSRRRGGRRRRPANSASFCPRPCLPSAPQRKQSEKEHKYLSS